MSKDDKFYLMLLIFGALGFITIMYMSKEKQQNQLGNVDYDRLKSLIDSSLDKKLGLQMHTQPITQSLNEYPIQ